MGRHRHSDKHYLSPRARFYKSLRGYIITLSAFFLMGILVDHDFFNIMRFVALWWGIGLTIRFFKLRGLPGTKGWLSDDWFDWIKDRHPYEDAPEPRRGERKIPIDGKDYDPLWKDKDMV